MNATSAALGTLSPRQLQDHVARLRHQIKNNPERARRIKPEITAALSWLGEHSPHGGHVCPRCELHFVATPDPRNVCAECLAACEPMRPSRAD